MDIFRWVWVWFPLLGWHLRGSQGLHQKLDVCQCRASFDLRVSNGFSFYFFSLYFNKNLFVLQGCLGPLLDHWCSKWEEHSCYGFRTAQEEFCQVAMEGKLSFSKDNFYVLLFYTVFKFSILNILYLFLQIHFLFLSC